MSLLPPDNFWLKLPGNSVPQRHWKASYLILSMFDVGPCERGKRRIIRHHSVLFHVASWRGCYWVFEGDLWYVRCSVPYEKSQLMIWVSVHVSALMPVFSPHQCFCQKRPPLLMHNVLFVSSFHNERPDWTLEGTIRTKEGKISPDCMFLLLAGIFFLSSRRRTFLFLFSSPEYMKSPLAL